MITGNTTGAATSDVQRMLWTLRTLGEAYRRGVIQIDTEVVPGLGTTAKTLLDELADFSDRAQRGEGI